jgi:hypothetical protein
MTIYPDAFYKGQWFYCKDCKQAGDMLNLAATIWETTEVLAAKNLRIKGIIPDYFYFEKALGIYQAKCLDLRKKHLELWKKATDNSLIFESGELRDTLKALNITVPKNSDEWNKGMGKLVGAAHRRDIEEAIAVPSDMGERRYTRMTGDSRPFVGKWRNMLIIPFFDMPGRIREFRFISHNGNSLQYASKMLCHRRIITRLPILAFFDQIASASSEEDLIVVDNLEVALALHSRNLRETGQMLPLCAIADTQMISLGINLHPYKFTLWNPELSVDIFKGLKESGVKVYLNEKSDWSKFDLQKFKPKVWIDKVREGRKPILEVLDGWLDKVGTIEAQVAVGGIAFSSEDVDAISGDQYPNLNKTLKSLSVSAGKTITLNGEQFYEKENGWFSKKKNNPISTVKIKIDKIIAKEDKTINIGEIIYSGKSYPFYDEDGELDSDPCELIRKILIKDGKICLGINERYAKHFKSIAMMFNPPEIVKESVDVGWDSSENVFRFCNFTISKMGDVFNTAAKSPKHKDLPTSDIEYTPINMSDLMQLTEDNHTNKSFWALAACAASTVISPATLSALKRFTYYGDTSAATDVVCEWFGILPCSEKSLNSEKTQWPIVIPQIKRSELSCQFDSWFLLKKKPQCFVESTRMEAYIMHLFLPTWTALKIEFDNQVNCIEEAAKKVLPNFLPWLLGKYGFEFNQDNGMVLGLLSAMAEWVKELGVNPDVLKKSEECFKATTSKTHIGSLKAFKKICQYGLEKQWLTEGPTQDAEVMLTSDFAHIDKQRFYDILKEEGFKLAEGLDIQKYLDLTLPQKEMSHKLFQDRFVVDRAWWEDNISESRGVKTLRIAR